MTEGEVDRDGLGGPPATAEDAGGSPPAERRFDDDEIVRILRKATELQVRSPAEVSGDAGGDGLTLAELRRAASEAGIEPRFVELAASTVGDPVSGEGSRWAGGEYAWRVRRTVPGAIPEEDRDRIVQAIRDVIGQKGELSDVYGRMEWSYDDNLGPVIVGLASREGKTEIDVSAVRTAEAGVWHGIGVPIGGLLGGAVVAGLFGAAGPAEVLPLVGGMTVVSYGAIRGLWSYLSGRWRRRVDRLAERVTERAAELATSDGD